MATVRQDPTKLVVRGLPPNLDIESFYTKVQQCTLENFEQRYFVQGKERDNKYEASLNSRAYFSFSTKQEAGNFYYKLKQDSGFVFESGSDTVTPKVEACDFIKMIEYPAENIYPENELNGTLAEDPDFLKFKQFLETGEPIENLSDDDGEELLLKTAAPSKKQANRNKGSKKKSKKKAADNEEKEKKVRKSKSTKGNNSKKDTPESAAGEAKQSAKKKDKSKRATELEGAASKSSKTEKAKTLESGETASTTISKNEKPDKAEKAGKSAKSGKSKKTKKKPERWPVLAASAAGDSTDQTAGVKNGIYINPTVSQKSRDKNTSAVSSVQDNSEGITSETSGSQPDSKAGEAKEKTKKKRGKKDKSDKVKKENDSDAPQSQSQPKQKPKPKPKMILKRRTPAPQPDGAIIVTKNQTE